MEFIKVQKKTVEQIRLDFIDLIYLAINKETHRSIRFVKNADYLNAKLAEAKIEAFHTILGEIIDVPAINVKEGK